MNIIVFSPHPDDAEVMMGGTIAKYTKQGHNVLIVLVTIPNNKSLRRKEAIMASEILGAKLQILDLDPYKLSFNRYLVEIFDGVLMRFTPDIIYTSWIHDSHQDHIAISHATIASARNNTCSLYMFEQSLPSGLPSYTFSGQAFVDISDTIETKVESVLAHNSQVKHFTDQWIDGIRGRAAYWGFQINAKYAEAFEVVKEIKQI